MNLLLSGPAGHSRLALRVGIGLVVLCCLLLLFPFLGPAVVTALPAGYQEYYIMGNETQIFEMFQAIQDVEGSSIGSSYVASVVTIVATVDHQTIYYDHWEDGYEADILDPVQTSTTEVYTGSIRAGDVITLTSTGGIGKYAHVPVDPRGTALRYDSGDRLVSTGGPIDVVHSLWPSDTTIIGGAWEIYPNGAWANGYSYIVPVGVDLYDGADGYFADFKYVWLTVQALDDNTTVHIDNGDETISVRLERGQTYASMGYRDNVTAGVPSIVVNGGTTVLSNKPVQVGLVTGGDGTFQTRFYTLVPDTAWGSEYIAPIPRTTTPNQTEVYLYNPGQRPNVVTAYDAAAPLGFTFTLTAATPLAYRHPTAAGRHVPAFSALRLQSDSPLWAIASADTARTSYDWGFALVPSRFATQDYYVSWAPGTEDLSANGSPVWVAPFSDNTAFNVDYSNPTIDGIPDEQFVVDALQTRRIFDPDNDNTGMHLWANKPFVVIWGIDPATAEPETNFLDLGYSVLPLHPEWLDPVLTLYKRSDVQTLPPTGGTVTFDLHARASDYPVGEVKITDTLPLSWTYVTDSALITYPDGSTGWVEPTIGGIDGRVLSWDLGVDLAANQSVDVRFQAHLTMSGDLENAYYDDFDSGDYNGGIGWSGPWTEYDLENCGGQCVYPTTQNSPHGGDYHLAVRNQGAISRTADLDNFRRPALRFWRRLDSVESEDAFYLRLYDGTVWTTVLTLTNASGLDTYTAEQLDLTAFRSPDFALELRGGTLNSSGDYVYLDDVQIFDAIAIQENTATATGLYRDHLFNSQDKAVVILTPLSLRKHTDKATVAGGETLHYTLTYTNGSSLLTLTNVLIRDILPANTSFLGASPGATYLPAAHTVVWGLSPTMTLPPSASDSLTVTLAVDDWVSGGQILRNEGFIDSDQTPEAASNAVETIVLAPQISLAKSGPASAIPGQVITYTIHYANDGAVTATGVVITDVIPLTTTYQADSLAIDTGNGYVSLTDAAGDDAGQFTGDAVSVRPGDLVSGEIEPGEQGSVRFAVRVNPVATPGENVANYATLVRDYARPQNSALLLTAISDLTLEKKAGRPVVNPGSQLAYTITLNSGGILTQDQVHVQDAIPAHTVYVPGTVIVPTGFVLSFSTDHGQTWVSAPPADPALVTDLRWYTPVISDPGVFLLGYGVQVDDPLGQGNVTIVNRAWVTSAQTALLYSDEVRVPTVDLVLNKSHSAAVVAPGQRVTYTLTYGNNGSAPAPGAVITDRVPASTTLVPGSITGGGVTDGQRITWTVDLAAQAPGATVRFVAAVNSEMPLGTSVIANTAYLSSPQGGRRGATVTTTVVAAPALQITKSAAYPIPLGPGDLVTYTIVVTNSGGARATGGVISDFMPDYTRFVPGSITLDPPDAGLTRTAPPLLVSGLTLAAGQRATVTLVAAISQTLAVETVLTNTASVTVAELPTPVLGTVSSRVVPVPAIHLAKSGPGTATVGDTLLFDFVVTNAGNTWLRNVAVMDDYAGAAHYVAGDDGDGWLALSEAWVYTAAYTVQMADPDLLANTGVVQAEDSAGTPVSASDTHTTVTQGWPILSLRKRASADVVAPGETFTYTLYVTNNGRTARGLTVGDVLPDGVTFAGCGGAVCGVTDGAVVWGPVELAGPYETLSLTLRVAAGENLTNGQVIANRDYWLVAEEVPLLNGPPLTTTVNVARLSLTKWAVDNDDEVYAGSRLKYALRVDNTGGYATGLVVSDTLPAHTSFGGCDCTLVNRSGVATSPSGEGICGAPFVCDLAQNQANQTDEVVWRVDRIDGGRSLQMTFWVTVDADLPEGSLIVNDEYAAVADHLSPVKGSPPVTMTVRELLVSVSKTAWPDPVTFGQQVFFTITVRNEGDLQSNVTVTDRLPDGLSYVSCSPQPWCEPVTGDPHKVMWWIEALEAQSERELTVVGLVGDVPGGTLVNRLYGAWVPAAEQWVVGPPVQVAVLNPFSRRLYLPVLMLGYSP